MTSYEPGPGPDVFPVGKHWDVHKFGGTCVATPGRMQDVVDLIVRERKENICVVVSAMGSHPTSPVKVTDLLLNMLAKASKLNGSYAKDLEMLRDKHVVAARELLGESTDFYSRYIAALDKDIEGIVAILKATEVAGTKVGAFEDFIVGHGELWSARMIAFRFQQQGANAVFMDARDVLVVRPTETGEDVDVLYAESAANLNAWGTAHGVPAVIVCTGFIARTDAGRITTLKRNGSDYTATIMGALLQANAITIWTDVNGVYSADPRKVKDAQSLEMLSYNEAWELAYFGANVLHPRSTIPAMRYRIPIVLRNIFDLSAKGSVITTHEDASGKGRKVKGFATVDGVSLIEVMGTGMVGVPGTASAIFGVMRDNSINVIIISQASSEHSVCFAVKMADSDRAVEALRGHFAGALKAGRIQDVYKIDNCAVLTAVGEDMHSSRGISAKVTMLHMHSSRGISTKLFTALAKAQVNIRATAQGASEYNITVVIDGADAARALRSVHTEFYAEGTPLGVAVVGAGNVGKSLLQQLGDQIPRMKSKERGVDMRVLAIATSKKMLLSDTPIDIQGWEARFQKEAVPTDLSRLGAHVKECCTNAVVVDCTAYDEAPGAYMDWMRQGLHIVTANKRAGAGDLVRYKLLKKELRKRGLTWHYETTVGSGMPVLHMVRHAVTTGDRVDRIECLFDGAASALVGDGAMVPEAPFCRALEAAWTKGISGEDRHDPVTDAAQKLVILAREAGSSVDLAAVAIDLADDHTRPVTDIIADAAKKAAEKGHVLRIVGIADVARSRCSIQLRSYPTDHPLGALGAPGQDVVTVSTARFANLPLVIRGPSHGAEVAAASVFSDLLRLANHLGATM